MSDLSNRVRQAQDLDESYALKESHSHCQSGQVQSQISRLGYDWKQVWFAGHHSGFHAGVKAERARTSALDAALADAVEALELAQGQCGIPDAGDACRAILRTAREALTRIELALVKP